MAAIFNNPSQLNTPTLGSILRHHNFPLPVTTPQYLAVPSTPSPVHGRRVYGIARSSPASSSHRSAKSFEMVDGAPDTNNASFASFSPQTVPIPFGPSPTPGPSVLSSILPRPLPKEPPEHGQTSPARATRSTRTGQTTARKTGDRTPRFKTAEEWDAVHRYPDGELIPAKQVGTRWQCVCSDKLVTLKTINERHRKFEHRSVCSVPDCGKILGRRDALVRHECEQHKIHVNCKKGNRCKKLQVKKGSGCTGRSH